jgi:hypothetical protein
MFMEFEWVMIWFNLLWILKCCVSLIASCLLVMPIKTAALIKDKVFVVLFSFVSKIKEYDCKE